MLDISFLYSGLKASSVTHRYGDASDKFGVNNSKPFKLPSSAGARKPVVVWNITRSCNLKCLHCYSDSESKKYSGELSTDEAKLVIDDLARYEIPVLLFSGGEPLVRSDIFELARYAKEKGLRIVLSTNGALITSDVACKIKESGFSYVGVSLDGMEKTHDHFRGVSGAFARTVSGIRELVALKQKTGLRLTLTPYTIDEIDALFEFILREKIQRVCFYHLVPSGRGKSLFSIDLAQIRAGVERIIQKTNEIISSGYPLEVLTVDNHSDAPFLYLKLRKEKSQRATDVYNYLKWNGGALYSSGIGIASIDAQGNVHPDQFWSHYLLGNVRRQKFSEIWSNANEPLLQKLRNRKEFVKGRCKACQFFYLCGGSLRVRADVVTGDPWAPDPACYLTDEEIGV